MADKSPVRRFKRWPPGFLEAHVSYVGKGCPGCTNQGLGRHFSFPETF
ncbi:hypothetical protein PpBr36_07027 [Pyricularia pennisetigena]|nr:hypothetical protein PpBr36_07027 [Pyricularia pennisetigena]TLS25771.1 hypothetical protein PpBr36_07027 [Pyricularia pennisetigena]